MKKWTYRIATWAMVFGALGAMGTAGSSRWVSATLWEKEHRLTLDTVERILASELDLFPRCQTRKLAAHFLRLCRRHRLDPAMVLSLIEVESRFRVRVVSPAGAVGLMQVQPETAQFIAGRIGQPFQGARSLKDPFVNLELGTAYLAFLRDKYADQGHHLSFIAYNMGPAALDRVLEQGREHRLVTTRKYYEAIMRGVDRFRTFGVRAQERPRVSRTRA